MAVMVIWSTKPLARETGMPLEAIAVLLVVSESFYESNAGKKRKVPWGVKKKNKDVGRAGVSGTC